MQASGETLRRNSPPLSTNTTLISSDDTVESVFIYIIKQRDGSVTVEEDRHITGMFSVRTWLGLMEQAGFRAKRIPYPVHEDGRDAWLLVGILA